jgi:inner membrane protein
MLYKTHLLAALLVSLFVIDFFNVGNPIIFVLLFTFSTMLPDLDTPKSKLGRQAGILSTILSYLFGHRGFLHSIWIPLALLIGLWYKGFPVYGFAIFGGYMTHLIVDALTLGGVKFFWLGKKTKGIFKTGGLAEIGVFLLLIMALLWKIKQYFV